MRRPTRADQNLLPDENKVRPAIGTNGAIGTLSDPPENPRFKREIEPCAFYVIARAEHPGTAAGQLSVKNGGNPVVPLGGLEPTTPSLRMMRSMIP